MTETKNRPAFLEKLEAYIGTEVPHELMEVVNGTAERFENWGRSAAIGKCAPASEAIFQTVAAFAFAGNQEVAEAMADHIKTCYMIGFERGQSKPEANHGKNTQEA